MQLSQRARGTLTLLGGALVIGLVGQQACTKPLDQAPETEVVSRAATAKYDWMQFGGGPSHSGNNTLETQISQTTVSKLTKLFQVGLPETAEGQPVVLTGVSTANGTHDVAFVTTRNGYVVAMDAYTGVTLWSKQLGGANITMSSPAIDPSRAYVYGVGLDGSIHKLAIGTGVEVTGGGWPELATLKTNVEKDGTALGIATVGGVSYLYLGAGGYDGDGGEYQGHVTTVNLNTGAQKVFNAMCSNNTAHLGNGGCSGQKSGIWAKAGITYDPLTNRIYAATGNGTFSPSTFMWGDSILALNPDGSGAGNGNPLDSYTPSNYQTLQNNDKDLGSTNLLILPNNGSKYPHLGMQSGKDQLLRLINLDNMSGQGAPGKVAGEVSSTALATGGEVQNPCATWINPADSSTWVFVVSPSNGINASKLQVDGSGNPSLVNQWHQGGGGGGAHVANNVLYWASNANVHALNPTTGAQLWNSTLIGSIHWQTPLVTNGVLYVTDSGRKITAYSLGGTGGAGGSGGSTGAGGSTGSGGETALSRTGWTASASNSGGDVPANAIDGNTASRWSTGTAMTAGMWFQIDLGAAKTFDQIVMDSAGSTNDYARGFQIFVSNDGTNFGNAVVTGTGAAAVVQASFPAQTARYFRVVLTSTTATNWWSIAEINAYTGGSGGTAGTSGSAGTTGGAGSGTAGASGGSGGATATKINCGGPAAAPFVADIDFAGGSTINHANTIDTSGVSSPAPAAVYQTARLGNYTYTIPGFTAGSTHTVRLHMCETFFTTAGSRLFNVTLNGTQVLTSFDIFQASGAKNKAVVQQFTQAANASGQYVVQTTSVKDNSLISGIEIQ
jgi:hypothetical protein